MTAPIRRRTRARELALQFLYAFELRGEDAMTELDSFIEHHTKTGDNTTQEGATSANRQEVASYAKEICQGVHDHLVDLNNWIEHIARNWRLERMAFIDRNILRIAMYELLFQVEVPFKVVINEAIDIAKRYSTAQSGSFVNGILDRARVLIQEARELGTTSIPNAPKETDGAMPTSQAADASSAGKESSPASHSAHEAPGSGSLASNSDPNAEPFPVPMPRRRRLKRRPTRPTRPIRPNESNRES